MNSFSYLVKSSFQILGPQQEIETLELKYFPENFEECQGTGFLIHLLNIKGELFLLNLCVEVNNDIG